MKRSTLVSQGTLGRLRVQVQQAWEDRNLNRCIEILERIARMAPADTWALRELGRMHGHLYDYESAERYFERAYQMSPPGQKAQALADAGQMARDFYNPSFAERYFERALNEPGVTAEILVKAAEVAERNRRMDDAARLVERALQLDSAHAAALFAHAHLQQRAGRLQEAEQELLPLLQLSVKPEFRAKAWYEVGAIWDRQGRYDEAMKAFLQAKALLRYEGGPHLRHRQGVLKRYAQFREDVMEEVLHRWFSAGSELQPWRRLALLGGHPRSGTTLLEQVLDAHPDIVSMEETDTFRDYVGMPLTRRFGFDTPFFQAFESASTDLLRAVRNDYWKASELCLRAPIGGRMLIDKHPSLTLSIPGVVRVFPEIRLLIALRDPRDVVLSCFMQPFIPLGPGNAMFVGFDTAVEEYAGLMGMWVKVRPLLPNAYLEVRYEDMVEDLEAVARRALDFLGAPWDERVLGFDEHARKKQVRSPTYADVTQKVFKRARGRWRNYQKYLDPHLPALEPFLKALGYD
jgi:Flp pilus assembly protein TadD